MLTPDPPPFAGRPAPPHAADTHWPADMPPYVQVHESAHIAVGRALGLRTIACLSGDGEGMTMQCYDAADPADVANMCVAFAAGPILAEMAGRSPSGCEDDFENVARLKAKYRAMTGRVLQPWTLARGILRLPEVGRNILLLAGAMRPGVAMSGSEIDAVLGVPPTPGPAEPDTGFGI